MMPFEVVAVLMGLKVAEKTVLFNFVQTKLQKLTPEAVNQL